MSLFQLLPSVWPPLLLPIPLQTPQKGQPIPFSCSRGKSFSNFLYVCSSNKIKYNNKKFVTKYFAKVIEFILIVREDCGVGEKEREKHVKHLAQLKLLGN